MKYLIDKILIIKTMNRIALLALCLLMMTTCQQRQQITDQKELKKPQEIAITNMGDVKYGDYLQDKTMRVDYYHSGNATGDSFCN